MADPLKIQTALSYLQPSAGFAERRRAQAAKLDQDQALFEEGRRQELTRQKQIAAEAEQQRKLQEAEQKAKQKAEAEAAEAERKRRLSETELHYRRQGRPTFTNAEGEILPVDDDETWASKQEEKRLNAQLKEQARADATFRKTQAIQITQKQQKLSQEDTTYQTASALAGQAVQTKAADLAAKSQRLRELENTAATEADFAEQQTLAAEIQTIRQEKQLLEDNERTVALARTNQEILRAPEAQALEAAKTALPLATAPGRDALRRVPLPSPSSASTPPPGNPANPDILSKNQGSPTSPATPQLAPASDDPAKAALVLRGLIDRLREKGDEPRAAALEQRLTDPEGWAAAQKQFRQTATPQQLQQTLEAEAPKITQTAADIQTTYTILAAQRQQILTRLADVDTRNAALLQQGGADADFVTLEDPQTGQTSRLHRSLVPGYEALTTRLQTWQKENQPKIDLLDIERQQLQVDATNLQKHEAQLAYLGRQQTRDQEDQRATGLNQLRAQPGMAPFADEIQELYQSGQRRLQDLETKYPDPTVRQVAAKSLQEDLESKQDAIGQRMAGQQEKLRQVYDTWAKNLAVEDWRDESKLPGYIRQKAEAIGISEKDLRLALETHAALDWSRPRKVRTAEGLEKLDGSQYGVGVFEDTRLLPNGDLTVNPDLWFDPTAYAKAAEAAQASPEAKQQAIAERRELASPLAAEMITSLSGDPDIAHTLAQFDGTPLERMEKLEAAMRGNGAWSAMRQRFAGGVTGVGKSIIGVGAGLLNSDTLRNWGSILSDSEAGYDTLAQMAEKGTGTLGKFAGKVAGATPSVAASLLPGGVISTTARVLGASFTTANNLARVGAAIGAGVLSGGSNYLDAFQAYRRAGLSETEAHGKSLAPMLMGGTITASLTGLFGAHGVESLIQQGGRELFKKTLIERAKAIGLDFTDEAVEEGLDQLFQNVIATASYNPGKPVAQIFSESLEAALIGGVLGGGLTTVKEAVDAIAALRSDGQFLGKDDVQPHQLPEVVAAAKESIHTLTGLDDIQRLRAMGALKIAQGKITNLTDPEARAMGWERQNGKWKPLKGYEGPVVLDFFQGDTTKPVLTQNYIDALDKTLPAVHAAIGLDEQDILEHYANPPSGRDALRRVRDSSPEGSVDTPVRSDSPSSPISEPRPTEGTPTAATPAPAPVPVPDGTAGKGTPSPGDAGTPARNASPSNTSPPVNPANPAILSKNQEASTPEAQRAQEIASHLALAGMDPTAAQQIADHAVATQGVIGKTYSEQITGPQFATYLDQLGVKGDRRTTEGTAPLTAPADLTDRLGRDALRRVRDSSPSQQSSPPVNPANPASLSKNQVEGLRSRIKTKEITDQDLVREVSRLLPNATPQQLTDILIQDLSLYPQRAKLAVLAAKDSLKSDSIPTAARGAPERSVDTPVRSGSPSPLQTSPPVNPGNPAILSKNQALQQPATQAIASLPISNRKRARTTLKALEKALQKWGAAWDRIVIDPVSTEDGTPAASAASLPHLYVTDTEGKMTLHVNLPELFAQFDYLARSEDAILATMSEEFVHAVALHLARTEDRFQRPRLIQLWDALDATGQNLVWQTYHNFAIQEGTQPETVPENLPAADKFHMAHEMLRLLVQQKAFREQFTEAVGPRRNILKWISNLLRTLSSRLTQWLKSADPALRSDLESYRAQIIGSLAHFEGSYTAETILLAESKAPQTTTNGSAATLQQLQTRAAQTPLTPAEQSALNILQLEAERTLQDKSLELGREAADKLLPGVSNEIQKKLLARQITNQAWTAQIQSLQARMAANLEGSAGTPARSGSPTQTPPPVNPANPEILSKNQVLALPGPAQVSALNLIDALEQREFAAQQNASPEASRQIRKRLLTQMWEALFLDISARVERRLAYKDHRLTAAKLYQLDDVLRVARGDFQLGTAYDRRVQGTSTVSGTPIRPIGFANMATLERLGIAITENGLLYSTSPNSPAYVERNQILIRQSYLDELAQTLPITRQQIAMDEAQARDYFGLPEQSTPTTGRNLPEAEGSADTPVRSPDGRDAPPGVRAPSGLPDPSNFDDRRTTGADLISFLQREGLSLGWPSDQAKGEWDWFRNLEKQAAALKEHAMTLKSAASRGEVDHPRALLLWLENQGILDRSNPGSRLDEVAMAAESAGFDLSAGLGESILAAVDTRVRAKNQRLTQADPLAEAEAQTLRFERDSTSGPVEIQPGDLVAQWEEGSAYVFLKDPDGQTHKVSVTDAQWAPMDTETSEMDDYQDGSPWFRGIEEGRPERLLVTLQDGTTYGKQTLPAETPLRVDSPGNTDLANLNETELANLPDAPDGRDALRRVPERSMGTPARTSPSPASPPVPNAPQDTRALQDDYQQSVNYGRKLEDSIPDDIDLAATADDYLDSLEDPDAPTAPRIFAGQRNSTPRFYSQLAQVITDKMPNRADARTIRGIVENPQNRIKQEELKWTGLLPWLDSQTAPITKQAVQDYLATDGSVRLEEVRGGEGTPMFGDWLEENGYTHRYHMSGNEGQQKLKDEYTSEHPSGGTRDSFAFNPKYAEYQLPGGTNYREVVLAMPPKDTFDPSKVGIVRARTSVTQGAAKLSYDGKEIGVFRDESESPINNWRHPDSHWIALVQRRFEQDSPTLGIKALSSDYRSSHFTDVPNYVAHTRLNDRTDADGKPGTFMEELQSDRHQQGREKGYSNDATLTLETAQAQGYTFRPGGRPGKIELVNPAGENVAWGMSETEALARYNEAQAGVKIPDAPHRKDWPLALFKRALADAVASGKAWIGWTTGETQAARYDLSKQVDRITVLEHAYAPGTYTVTATRSGNEVINKPASSQSEMADLIGKDLAKKAVADIEAAKQRPVPKYATTLAGLDLKVGGEGMKGFYDNILPKEIGKYVKQWNAKVEKGGINGSEGRPLNAILKDMGTDWGSATEEQKDKAIAIREGRAPMHQIWRVDITPEMKASVQAGQALFASPRLTRSIHPLALPGSRDTLTPDERLRSPAHILADLSGLSGSNTGTDARPDRRQRREPGPSVGGRPGDHSRLLDWARTHGRIFPVEDIQVGRLSDPSQVRAGGEHLVMPGAEGRLYRLAEARQEQNEWLLNHAEDAESGSLPGLASSRRMTTNNSSPGNPPVRKPKSSPLQLQTGEVAALKDFVNGSISDPITLRQSLNGRSLLAKLDRLIQRPSKTPELVDIHMLPLGDDLKIINGVVESIPISVVNDLLLGELSAKKFLHNETVFEPLPSNTVNLNAQKSVASSMPGKFPDVSNDPAHEPNVTNDSSKIKPILERIEAAAQNTDTAPSDPQKEAGNYQKGKFSFHGLRISIENPRGSIRRGRDANGKDWSITMPHHYGYFLSTKGKDKDHVDVFIGPNPTSEKVFIVNQRKPGNGHFDEHKALIGFDSPGLAARGYLDSYTKGWRGYQSIVQLTIPELQQWLASGDMTQPMGRDALRRVPDSSPSQQISPPVNPANLVNPVQKSPTLPASLRSVTDTIARASFNHLDRRLHVANTRLLNKVTSTAPAQAAIQAIQAWYGSDRADASVIRSVKELIQGQIIPETVLPREVLSAMREMNTKIALGQQAALDVGRALQGNPKFSDLAYPAEFVENPAHRARLFDAMEGKIPMTDLPPSLQKVATKLRQMLVEAGREAVRQGRMSPDTFEGLRTTYMPRFTKDEAQASSGDWHKAFKLGVRDILAQRSTAYHITDTTRKDKTGLPVIVSHTGNRWRFDSPQARDAFYEELIAKETLDPDTANVDWRWMTKADSRLLRTVTADMLKAPGTMSKEQRELVARVQRQLRAQFAKENPYDPPELIKDPVYAVMRYLAQMTHDNATAEFFNLVATHPDWTTTAATRDFKEIPDSPRFGRLAGLHVRKDIADQVLELADSPHEIVAVYDTLLRLWKTGKTVLNPSTHARNIIGNIPFSQFAGNNILNPANAPYYWQALQVLRKGGPEYNQLFETGVLGADYASSELRSALQTIIPVVQNPTDDANNVLKHVAALGQRAAEWAKVRSIPSAAIGGTLGAAIGMMAAGPIGAAAGATIGAYANPIYRGMLWAYRIEDDLFKAAAFFKAQSMGMTPAAAADHVRDWFPYYDKPTSATLKFAGRTALPFVSFFRESGRIGVKAAKERPLALAASLAIPGLITAISAVLLGLSDDDLDDVKEGMRGKGAKLLGATPLAGVPLFSMLLPVRTADGKLQQMDLSSTYPFADFLADRVENFNNDPWWQTWARSALSNPMMGLVYTAGTGRDPFGDRTLWDSSYTPEEKQQAIFGHVWKTVAPPLAPGGSNWQTLETAGRRQANKTLALRNPTQAVARSVFGLDVRSADPDIYRLADELRKEKGLVVKEGNQAWPTDASGRARKALFEELVQPKPDTDQLAKILQTLNDLGSPVRTVKDILDLLDRRRPDAIIRPKGLRPAFRASLNPEASRVYEGALGEFQKARLATPAAFAEARKKINATTRPPATIDE